jgi:hypothetical protein
MLRGARRSFGDGVKHEGVEVEDDFQQHHMYIFNHEFKQPYCFQLS